MFSILRRIPKSRLALFTFGANGYDTVKTPGYEDLEKKYTGMTALKKMFSLNQYGEWSPELTTVIHMSSAGCLIGVLTGAFLHGRVAWANFIENNQATQFINHLDAKKQLQDRVTLAMGKGALKWGVKVGSFTSLFVFTSTCIRVYRGEPGFIEFLGAGSVTGGLLKLQQGPKGVFAGAIIGLVLGAITGAAQTSLLYLSGYTIDDIERNQYEMQRNRTEAIRQGMKTSMLKEYEQIQIEEDIKKGKLSDAGPLDDISPTEKVKSITE